MKLDFAARVDIGPRETNDDRVLIDGQILNMRVHNGTIDSPAIAAVCDGCGGYSGGHIAAETVLEFLSYESPHELADVNYLSQVLSNCQQMVMEKKAELPQYSEMCTTVAGCVFLEDGVVFFHSGDSRVYRHDSWSLARMTRDHSVVQDMVDSGRITPEEALASPRRNVINRCIGISCPSPEIYVTHSPICPGEKYLLCSDGLWESVRDTEIKEILDSEMPLYQMVDTLVERAIEQGADDNISVCICARQGSVAKEVHKPFILD